MAEQSYAGRQASYPEKGALFGLWSFVRPGKGYNWTMACSCGTVRECRSQDIRNGSSKSCGCTKPNNLFKVGKANKVHGVDYGSKLYRAWRNAKNRCFNPKAEKYKTYGLIGITMSPLWAADFKKFAEDVGEAPSSLHTLDRIDPFKGYEPGNVRWATFKEQSLNKTNTLFLEHLGVKKPLMTWAQEFGISYSVAAARYYAGHPVEKILFVGKLPRSKKIA